MHVQIIKKKKNAQNQANSQGQYLQARSGQSANRSPVRQLLSHFCCRFRNYIVVVYCPSLVGSEHDAGIFALGISRH